MRNLIGSIAAIAMLALAQAASAEEVSGKVEAMDVRSRTILLDDGNAYTLGQGIAIEALQPGTEVTVSYEEKNGRRVVTELEASK